MELSFLLVLLVVVAPVLCLPLIGRKWSAIFAYLIFGFFFTLGLVFGYLGLSQPPAGPSHDFSRMYLWAATFSGAMILLTYIVRRRHRLKAKKQSPPVD